MNLDSITMDSDDMTLINDIYKKILNNGMKLYDMSDNNMNINHARQLEAYSTYLREMNEKLACITTWTNKYAIECLNKAAEIRKYVDISSTYTDETPSIFKLHQEMHNGMSWADISENELNKEIVLNNVEQIVNKPLCKDEYKQPPIMYKTISNLYGKDMGFEWKVPIINNLNDMPASLYWYAGDSSNPSGIYTCLNNGFYIQVPFPNIIDSSHDSNKSRSVKCKNNTIQECLEDRQQLANQYKSAVRECNFAHVGDNYIKIGTLFRCPNKPRFGNHNYLKDDIVSIKDTDIKTILMYALSDVLISSMWFQNKDDEKKLSIMTNIDICC
jgi:hypothetical protein